MNPASFACCLAMTFLLFNITLEPALAASDPVPRRMVFDDVELQLNGYGEREIFWTDVYRCALYLSEPSNDRAAIIATREPKALVITVLIDNLPDDMPQRWRETLSDELNREMYKRMKSAFRGAGAGDELRFAYVPGVGTRVTLNGERILVDPGYGLMAALLDQWLGGNAVSRNLRRLLSSPGAVD